MVRRLIGKRKPHKRPGTAARQERRKAARERLAENIVRVSAHVEGRTPEERFTERFTKRLARMRGEYASLGRSLGIVETVGV